MLGCAIEMNQDAAIDRKPRVFAGLSGGVDSSVAAALLKERGFDVVGIHIKMWSDPRIPCTTKEDRYDAMAVAAKLDIPFQTWDFSREYRQAVVEYMIREYAAGRTPNPDVMCNREIKFGIFLEKALEAGADYVATGHYVRLRRTDQHGEVDERDQFDQAKRFIERSPACRTSRDSSGLLLQAADQNKDQSYFLWTLTQKQLRHCLFPIGEYAKPEVRKLARRFGLPTAEKPDSQGICFIGEIDIREFLKEHIPSRKGRVLTAAGKAVGEHDGVAFYTIGQRQGLGIGGGIPYYVARKDADMNTLTVAAGPYDERLFQRELVADEVHWISGRLPPGGFPLRCEARIRYRQPLQPCEVAGLPATSNQQPAEHNWLAAGSRKLEAAKLKVTFSEAQRAVTPGQSIVFYSGEEMLGGGVIS